MALLNRPIISRSVRVVRRKHSSARRVRDYLPTLSIEVLRWSKAGTIGGISGLGMSHAAVATGSGDGVQRSAPELAGSDVGLSTVYAASGCAQVSAAMLARANLQQSSRSSARQSASAKRFSRLVVRRG